MNIIDILKEHNIPIAPTNHHHCTSGWVNIDCPFCSKDSHGWHLGINLEFNYCSCWRCGSKRLIETIMELTGLPYNKVKKMLGDLETEHFEKQKPLGTLVIPSGIKELSRVHKEYLYDRGFNWQKIKKLWKVFGIGIAPRLQWRIWIPIHYHSEIVSWTTRSISYNPNVARYISAGENEEAIPHKELLYGEDFVRHAVIVTEGPIDAWRIGQGAVSTFGSGYSQKQLLRISKYPIRAVCFDREPEAQKRASHLCNDLSVFPGETFNIELDSKDPGEATRKEIKQIRKEILE